jgi:hypothetical protein
VLAYDYFRHRIGNTDVQPERTLPWLLANCQSALPELPWVFNEAFPSDEAGVDIRGRTGSLSD